MTRILDWLLNASIGVVMLLAIFVVGPEIETRFFPVYSRFELIEAVPFNKGSKIVVRYTKFRHCFPQGYAWYSGDLGKSLRQLSVSAHPRVPIQSVGRHEQTIEIDVTPPEIMNNLYAEVFSRCHPLWITRSVVFG